VGGGSAGEPGAQRLLALLGNLAALALNAAEELGQLGVASALCVLMQFNEVLSGQTT